VYYLHGILAGVGKDVAWHDVNLCFTNELQDFCFKNGGIYMKLG
jgi:hypothetical protein